MTRIAILLIVAALATPAPATALLAVFTDGRVLRVDDARLDGSSLVLTLPGGGVLEVPAIRIDRVVSDEVEFKPFMPGPEPVFCPWDWHDIPLPSWTPYRDEIRDAARRAGLHPWLVAAVVQTESDSDPHAVSRAGAAGLMQLMPAAAADHGVLDPFDPVENLRGGSRHLRLMLDRFGDLDLALAAYNAGATTVERYGNVPPYRETRDYVRRVLRVFCPDAIRIE
jgi:hypothetical protein